ncbi:MAG: hypothetical protein D6708_14685 [Candidatus Dadabacteria bacterium]|nr:MAG: hypothetical protein D6708_14685 [Candidatus Dadabacteria bacterium]
MWRGLGLTRDPFAAAADGGLFWETPEREAVRRGAVETLQTGRPVAVTGPGGSGRDTLVASIADDALARGMPVLWVPVGEGDFLAAALEAIGAASEGDDRAALLCEAILERFQRAGPVVVAVEGAPGAEGVAELAFLAGLRVAGHPLALPLWVQEGPVPAWAEEEPLPPPSREDLREFVFHRLAACGGPDLLPPAVLDALASRAEGLGHALALGRRELRRLAFRARVEEGTGPDAGAVLPADALDEVEDLLSALGPDDAEP